jgi:predicted Zn-dependent protease
MVLSDRFRAYGGLAAQAVQLMNLSYSRGDESQADRLGLRYISRSGYDADAMIGVFEMLGAASAGGGGRLPEWQMTHPLPENREVAIRQEIAATGASREGTVNRDVYLDMIDGLVWGANPREGYFEGARFFHPELAFEVTFPEGWETVNQRTLVAAVAPTKDAVLTLGAEPESPDPSAALRAFLTSEGVSGGAASTEEVNGFPAARARFRLTTDDETLAGEVVFLRHRDRTYRLLAYAGPDRWAAVAGLADGMFGSFAEVTDVDVLGVQPLRLEVITLREATSLNRWVQSHPQPVDLETLTRLNRIAGGEVLGAGTRIKTVAGTPVG